MSYRLKVIDQFAAGHCLPLYKGKCENMHGHNFKVEVEIEGEQLDEGGLLFDFAELKKLLTRVLDRFDHKVLNEVPPFNKLAPSSENIARVISVELSGLLDAEFIRVRATTVWESENACATYFL